MGDFYLPDGALIGNYRIISSIEVGAFKQVYKAIDRQPVEGRPGIVALKLFYLAAHVDSQPGIKSIGRIKPEDFREASEQTGPMSEKFMAEYEAMRNLPPHANVAKVYDCYTTPIPGKNGFHYIINFFTEELIEGKDLEKRAVEECRGYSTKDFFNILLGVARGVKHLQDNGVLHYDLKPSNILLREIRRGKIEPEHAVITDFGNANQPYQRGSILFMSPEQIQADQSENLSLDVRSDIYSLGEIAYLLFSRGTHPFYPRYCKWNRLDEDERIKLRPTIEKRVMSGKYMPLKDNVSHRFRRNHNNPRGLLELVDSMISLKPEDRPQSMDEVISVLKKSTPR